MRDITIQWNDTNLIENGYKVYRSESSMDINNMPNPITELEPNSTQFIDKYRPIGVTYYYIASAWIDGYEVFSDEIMYENLNGVVGPQLLIGGDLSAGFYGEVEPSEFITASDLLSTLSVSGGTPINQSSMWLKFSLNGNIRYTTKLPILSNISPKNMEAQNLFHGEREITINNINYSIKTWNVIGNPPASSSVSGNDNNEMIGSEWVTLMYNIHSTVPNNQIGSNWVNYNNTELGFSSTYEMARDRSTSPQYPYVVFNNFNTVTRGSGTGNRLWRPILDQI